MSCGSLGKSSRKTQSKKTISKQTNLNMGICKQTNQLRCGNMCRWLMIQSYWHQHLMGRKVHKVLSAYQHSSKTCDVYTVWGWEQTSITESVISHLQKQAQCLSLLIPFTMASIILKSTEVKLSWQKGVEYLRQKGLCNTTQFQILFFKLFNSVMNMK